jgi:hypothetical protein
VSPPGGLLYRRALPAIGENVPWIRRELLAALERAEIAATACRTSRSSSPKR